MDCKKPLRWSKMRERLPKHPSTPIKRPSWHPRDKRFNNSSLNDCVKGTRTWGNTTQHILDPNVRTCSNIKHEVSQPICTSENQRGPAPAMRWALQSPLGSAPILRRCPLRSRSFLQASSVKLHIYSSSTVVVAVWWFLMVFGGFWLFEDCWLVPRHVFFFLCVCFFGESWN